MNLFSRDLGIDLGSSNVLIYSAGKGIILRDVAVANMVEAIKIEYL